MASAPSQHAGSSSPVTTRPDGRRNGAGPSNRERRERPNRERPGVLRRTFWAGRVAVAVISRPLLWAEALRVAFRFAKKGWWRSWPPIPSPPADYLAFRIQTNSGGSGSVGGAEPSPEPADVVAFLKWTGSHRHLLG